MDKYNKLSMFDFFLPAFRFILNCGVNRTWNTNTTIVLLYVDYFERKNGLLPGEDSLKNALDGIISKSLNDSSLKVIHL
jgi:hypothetical protein